MLTDMTAKISINEWAPLPGSLPETIEPETVYVLPTLRPVDASDKTPRYADNVKFLPKEVRSEGGRVEFATPEGTRRWVQHFSIDPEMWALGLVLLNLTSDWLLFTVERFINMRSRFQGWTAEEAAQLPLKVSIVETSTSRNIQVEGRGDEVLEALRTLQREGKSEEERRDDG
jgi:hypothetical protein